MEGTSSAFSFTYTVSAPRELSLIDSTSVNQMPLFIGLHVLCTKPEIAYSLRGIIKALNSQDIALSLKSQFKSRSEQFLLCSFDD